MNVRIETSWKEVLQDEFRKNYFKDIVAHIKAEKELGKTIYPAGSRIFHAFDQTPFNRVKAVILGQDPYHGAGQAMGLSFSVPRGVIPPPSLQNIFKELREDTGIQPPGHGDLTKWAHEGVLLLNASLTVRAGEPMSHCRIGWQQFTNAVIQTISKEKEHVVFLLWGKFAQEKQELINPRKHLVLKAAHPSPLSAHNGFFGCRHFSKTNQYLVSNRTEPIDWGIII